MSGHLPSGGEKGIMGGMRKTLAAFVLSAAFSCAAEGGSLSLDGDWRLDYFPQPDRAAVRVLPLKVDFKMVKAKVPGNCSLSSLLDFATSIASPSNSL